MITRDEILKIKELLQDELQPIGTIIIYPSLKLPIGFLECDGSWINKNEYPELYSIIGGIFGEDDTRFGLPDLRGRFVRGYDSSNIIDPQRSFGDYQEDSFQGHTHKTDWTDNMVTGENGKHSHSLYGDSRKIQTGVDGGTTGGLLSSSYSDYKDGNRTSDEGGHTHSLPNIILGDVCSSKYGKIKVGVETRPKNINLMFCIKAK